jgi:anti-anti-sigma regulatory factor
VNLRWKLRRGSDRLVVEMLGDFDETADLRDLAAVLRGRIAIDLGGVRRFSSAGVREWIHFVRSLPQGTDLSLVGCSPASVTQLNLIDNFRGPARVESFWAPYSCTACGAERQVLLEARAATSPGLPTLTVVHAHPATAATPATTSTIQARVARGAAAPAPSPTLSGSSGSSSGGRTLPAPPPVACTGCGHSMVLDELPQHYLLFLADRAVRLAERARA